ncbi:hypothetical protein OS493_020046 [Desmophyllum pertusum]|uniref:DUF3990 domain-containing protein n=1 Tax=Desmophyllum pertusum TaxID=174260 RepID=A0A9W9YBG2_9CNID|nr:hypothetical protein OS493_020046 [Desmophyllum pertusum]
MAVESMLSVVEQSWCIWPKTMDKSDYQQTENCLFAILGWLGQPKFENLIASIAPPNELISYLRFSFSKYVLSYSASVFTKYSRFPYQEDTINEWFTHSTDDVPRDQAVNIINIDKDGQTRKCYKTQNEADGFPQSLKDDGFEIFLHGTSYEHAEDIIENGIDLRRGKKGQDFSDGDGFYLGKNFDEAFKWTGIRRHPSSAVLVFRVKTSELRGDNNENGYDLQDPRKNIKKEWQEVVSQFRSGNPHRTFRKDLNRNYQFIEGPMASVSPNKPHSSRFPVQKDGTYQLCVRNDNCAKLFDRSLHSVVFFDK